MLDRLWLEALSNRYGCSLRPGVEAPLLEAFQSNYFPLPNELRRFYTLTNGLFSAGLTVLPIFDPQNRKRTWDSLNKANTEGEGLPYDKTFLEGNFVFAKLSGLDFAFLDRVSEQIYIAQRSAQKANFGCFEVFKTRTPTLQSFIEEVLSYEQPADVGAS